jgi:hypothetical protein
MTTRNNTDTSETNAPGTPIKDPADWKTGDEPMTGAQRSYLQTLCDEAGEPMDETLTKAEASRRIEELQHKTGRGADAAQHTRTARTDEINPTTHTTKDPADWKTGDEPMTSAQRSYLQTLCDEAGEPMDETLTKAEAAKRIDALQQKTGRGGATHERGT